MKLIKVQVIVNSEKQGTKCPYLNHFFLLSIDHKERSALTFVLQQKRSKSYT